MVKLNSLLRLAAISWFAVTTLLVACYAEDEQATEPDELVDETLTTPADQPPPDAMESIDTAEAIEPIDTPKAMGSIDAYREIVERPLFSETRRPPEPFTQPAAPAVPQISRAPAARADLVLLGVVITPDSRRAVLRSASDKKANLKGLGDDINGWQLAAIEPRKVRLTRGTEEKVLELERKAAPQRKPTKQTASRRRRAAAGGMPGVEPATTDPAKAARRSPSNTQIKKQPVAVDDEE